MSAITFGSTFSGIEAASLAWRTLGWRAVWLAEIDSFACNLLAQHYPDVPNLGNVSAIPAMLRNGTIAPPDVFTGGSPCQAFSLAGLRQSLDDARGNLSLTFCEIANEIDIQRAANGLLPCVVKWENVPGVLSTKDNAFGYFLAGLAGEDDPLVPPGKKWADAGCVYGPQRTVAWRILDAQYFGLAQRRRRVFVVASARKGFDPAAVLFEFDGVRRDSAPSREALEGFAGRAEDGTYGGGWPHDLAGTLDAHYGDKLGLENQHVFNQKGSRFVPGALSVALRGREGGATAELGDEVATCLRASSGGGDKSHVLTFHIDAQVDQMRFDRHVSASLTCSQHAGVMQGAAVRRLTPRECERLMGMPDDYTLILGRRKNINPTKLDRDYIKYLARGGVRTFDECMNVVSDGPRYKAIGNSWAIPVVRWIGARIDKALRESA